MPSRLDGPPKVSGQAKYGMDHNLPGTAYGHLVLSTIAHGEIESMDVTAAKSAPGVLGVYSPFDPLDLRPPVNRLFGTEIWVPLQDREVTCYGQPIGFVVAETFEQARDAAMLVEVAYRPRPAATSLADGLEDAVDAPPGFGGAESTLAVLAPDVESIEDALAASEVTVEATYRTAYQNHAAMEPHSAVAVWDAEGLTIYSGTQASDHQAHDLAGALGVEPSEVHAVNPFVGGAFGGKMTSAPAFLAAAAAKALGRPVKAALSREQVFTATANRPATVQRISLGADRDGTLNALRHESWSSTDANHSFVEPTSHGTSRSWYAARNLHLSQKMVPLNLPPVTFMRAPGEAPGSFALESAIDELAITLGMDPIELRLKNYNSGPPGSDLQWSSKHLDDCYRVGAAEFGWSERTPGGRTDGDWLVGMGMATAMFPAMRFPATVEITLRADETAVVATSGADPGTGLLTVLSVVGAESLDIPAERVEPRLGDSRLPSGGLSGGSTATASAGSAIVVAAANVIDALLALAAAPGGAFEGAEVTYADGKVHAEGRSTTFGEVLLAAGVPSISMTGSSGPGEEMTKHSFSSFGAQFCEVRVHRWTREARVSRMLGVFDAGRIINPKAARSQIAGGMIWGVSAALHEGLEFEANGRAANGDLASYLVPVNADIPEVGVRFIEHPDTLANPIGAKGIGEIGMVGMAAAVANAIHNATGLRIRELPITIEKLLGVDQDG